MANELTIPFAGQAPAQAFSSYANTQEKESLSDGIGSSYGVIGYKGKVWSLRVRGEKHTFTRKDDGSPSSYIDVIILRQARAKSKSFYDAYDPDASQGVRPICASLNGIIPDNDVQEKQATACALCPRNVWKVNDKGKKVRECTDYKRLAVLVLPNLTQDLLGSPLMEPLFLRVPPASLNDLATFGEAMANQGYPYFSFVTRISFDPNQPHPKMVFRPLQVLTNAEAPVVLALRDDPIALRITGEDNTAAISGAATPAALSKSQPLATGIVPQPAQPEVQATQEQAVQLVQQAKAPPPMLDLQANKPAEPERVSTGLTAAVTPKATAALTPAIQTVADVGEATESDAALDAQIAALL
jgi:hypothetical protein